MRGPAMWDWIARIFRKPTNEGELEYWKQRASDLEELAALKEQLADVERLEQLLARQQELEEQESKAACYAAIDELKEQVELERREELRQAEIAAMEDELYALKLQFELQLAANRAERRQAEADNKQCD